MPAVRVMLLAVLIVAGLSGCVDGGSEEDGLEPVVDPPTPAEPWRLVCPDGTPADAACATGFGLDAAQQYEPFLATDPARPGVVALAFMEAPGGADVTGTTAIGLRLWVSDDAGATWAERELPGALLDDHTGVRIENDPAMAFGPDGRLHFTWLSAPWVGADGRENGAIHHAASDDLGQTWGPVTTFQPEGSNDRQWIATGPAGEVLLVWQVGSNQPQVDLPPLRAAISADAGATWAVYPELREACNLASTPVSQDSGFLVACSDQTVEGSRVVVLSLGMDGTVTELGVPFDGGCGTNLLARGKDALLWGCIGGLVALSLDNGTTWQDPVLVGDLHDDLDRRIYWMATDPSGAVQALMGQKASNGGRFAVQHAAVCGARLCVAPTTLAAGAGGPVVGHYDAVAVGPEHGYVAWEGPDAKVRLLHLAA